MKQETMTPQERAGQTLRQLFEEYWNSAYMFHRMFEHYGLGAYFDANREWAAYWGEDDGFDDEWERDDLTDKYSY